MLTPLSMQSPSFPVLEPDQNPTISLGSISERSAEFRWVVGRPGDIGDNDQIAEGFAAAVVEFRRQRRITRNAEPLFDNG